MMDRRRALVKMCAAMIGVVSSSSSAFGSILRGNLAGSQSAISSIAPKEATDDAFDDRLRSDIARIAPRANSEEGVPVILACENLVTSKTSSKAKSVQLTTFNAAVVAEFRKNAEAWGRVRPNPAEADVAKLIQILAYRDFASGEMERRP